MNLFKTIILSESLGTERAFCFLGVGLLAAFLLVSPGTAVAEEITEVKDPKRSDGALAIDMTVLTRCKGKDTLFQITNRGERWPKRGQFVIFRTADKEVVNKRRFRLGTNQSATFRIRPAEEPRGELGLWINPSWYKRKDGVDARIECK